MESLSLPLSEDVRERLVAIARQTGRTLEQCAELALNEFVENWEIHLRDLDSLAAEEPGRPALAVTE